MRSLGLLLFFFLALCFLANGQNTKIDKAKIKTEIAEATNQLNEYFKEGRFMELLEKLHHKSPEYRNIGNGQILDYDGAVQLIKTTLEPNVKSVEYDMKNPEFFFIDATNVLFTFQATEKVVMKDDSTSTSGLRAYTVLWKNIDGKWKLAYLHGSE